MPQEFRSRSRRQDGPRGTSAEFSSRNGSRPERGPGPHIVVAQGLIGDDPQEVAAVLAHELNHWDRGDVVGLTSSRWPCCRSRSLCTVSDRFAKAIIRGALAFTILFWLFFLMSRFLSVEQLDTTCAAQSTTLRNAASIGYGPGSNTCAAEDHVLGAERTGWETVVSEPIAGGVPHRSSRRPYSRSRARNSSPEARVAEGVVATERLIGVDIRWRTGLVAL